MPKLSQALWLVAIASILLRPLVSFPMGVSPTPVPASYPHVSFCFPKGKAFLGGILHSAHTRLLPSHYPLLLVLDNLLSRVQCCHRVHKLVVGSRPNAAVYLSSGAAKFVTGVVLPVDGGASIGF